MGEGAKNRVDVLGVGVDPLTLDAVLERVDEYIREGGSRTVNYANVYCINIARGDPEFREILNRADLVYCDGGGVVMGARILGGRLPGRMTGADWIYDLTRHCARTGRSLHLMGSRPGVAGTAMKRLRSLYPSICITGAHHGYLSGPEEIEEAIAEINALGPDILLVGMGSPLQEKFLDRYRDRIEAPVCWTVGALFDFVAGVVPRAPKWMLDNGLEWLFRLLHEPRRMWRRYLVGNTLFLVRVFAARLTHRSGGRRGDER